LYPLFRKISATDAALFGHVALYPGQPPQNSAMDPNPTAWWLRPESSAARLGEHSAVTWNWL
jgi:hypothetical protein